jgi:hypothetical protein
VNWRACYVTQAAVGWAVQPFDTAAQDAELVAEESILGHERGLAARQISEGADSEGRDGRARGGQQPVLEAMDDGATAPDQAAEQASRQGQLPFRDGAHPGRKSV